MSAFLRRYNELDRRRQEDIANRLLGYVAHGADRGLDGGADGYLAELIEKAERGEL